MASFLQSIIISGAVAASGTSGTLYTCPANSYAIITLDLGTNTAGVTVTVGGKAAASSVTSQSFSFPGIAVGPGQAVAISANSPSATVSISGVQFTNST